MGVFLFHFGTFNLNFVSKQKQNETVYRWYLFERFF